MWIAVELHDDDQLDIREEVKRANDYLEFTGLRSDGVFVAIGRPMDDKPAFAWGIISRIKILEEDPSSPSSP